ncbi:MAG: hypothetical protein RRA92_06625 [Gemmatimonadota bacterium]|nr:hypothetical protein [Gemmatimonadota bacterium]
MTDPARGIVVAHGRVAEALVETVERIAGVRGALTALSNDDAAAESLADRVADLARGANVVLFADLASGSCGVACRRASGPAAEIPVVTGVNLPMLLDFVFHRDLPAAELARRAAEKGTAGIEALRSLEASDAARPAAD